MPEDPGPEAPKLDEKLIAPEMEQELAAAHLKEEARIKAQSKDAVLKAQQILATQLERLNDKGKADESRSGRNDSELPPEDIQFFSASRLSAQSSGLEIAICFDYELARESAEVVNIVREWPQREERAERLLKNPRTARWVGSGTPSEKDFTVLLQKKKELGSVDDVILQLVGEGMANASKIAAEMNVSKEIVKQRVSWLVEAGHLEKNGRGYKLASPDAPEALHGTQQREVDSLDSPLIPTICLAAAKWFPKPWLTIPWDDRKELVKRFTPVYDSFQPLSISEGYDPADKELPCGVRPSRAITSASIILGFTRCLWIGRSRGRGSYGGLAPGLPSINRQV